MDRPADFSPSCKLCFSIFSVLPARQIMRSCCRVIAYSWYITWPCDLKLWPFDLEQLSFMSSHVTNLATKYEDLTPIRSWVTSYKVITFLIGYHWKCVRGHCACAESRDPWVGGENDYIFGIPDPNRYAWPLPTPYWLRFLPNGGLDRWEGAVQVLVWKQTVERKQVDFSQFLQCDVL